MDTVYPTDQTTIGQAREYDRESAPDSEPAPSDEAMRLMASQLETLARMRAIGENMMERVERKASGLLLEREQPAFRNCDPILALNRLSRSLLQIMAMEQEIMGLREKGRRDIREERAQKKRQLVRRAVRDAAVIQKPDLSPAHLRRLLKDVISDRNYYDDFIHGSPREIIAKICAQLGIENPDLSIWPDGEVEREPEVETPAAMITRLNAEFDRARAGDLPAPPRLRLNGHDPP